MATQTDVNEALLAWVNGEKGADEQMATVLESVKKNGYENGAPAAGARPISLATARELGCSVRFDPNYLWITFPNGSRATFAHKKPRSPRVQVTRNSLQQGPPDGLDLTTCLRNFIEGRR